MQKDRPTSASQSHAPTQSDSETKRLFQIQDDQYEFPYHFIPHLDERGIAKRQRSLGWGYEYLCYMTHIAERIARTNPASILDVGCGEGRLLNMLGESCPVRMGVDLSSTAVAFAKAFTPQAEFFICDARDVPGTFDAVTAIQVLEHIPDATVNEFLLTLAERVSPAGHVYVCVPTTVQPLNRKHYRHYNQALFESQLTDSGAPLRLIETEFLVANKFLYRVYEKAGRFKTVFDFSFFRKTAWSYFWNRLRVANSNNGRHVLFILKRED